MRRVPTTGRVGHPPEETGGDGRRRLTTVPTTLADLLAPVSEAAFFASTWGKTHLHLRGGAGKFLALLPWAALNDLLRYHQLDGHRLRLIRAGAPVDSACFLDEAPDPEGHLVPRVRVTELSAQLRQGAALILNGVDELSPRIADLCRELERSFHERVRVNVYAGGSGSRGFDLHWDDHDVMVLQVAGRKRWRVCATNVPSPLKLGETPVPGDLAWEGILEDGDLLYLPRGFWHAAEALDEATLHLTIGIQNRTGVDLLHWLEGSLRRSELFRRDLPRFLPPEDRRAHMERLWDALRTVWSVDLLDQYLRAYDAAAEARPAPSLPWSASPAVLPPDDGTCVRWLAPRAGSLTTTPAGLIEVQALGKRWEFAAFWSAVLESLADGRSHSIGDLCRAADPPLGRKMVLWFLRQLLDEGLIAIEPASETD